MFMSQWGDTLSCAVFAGTIALAGVTAINGAPASAEPARTASAALPAFEVVVTKRRVAPECFAAGASATLETWCRTAIDTPVSVEYFGPRA
jgi:hypothetical protein